MFYNAIKYYYQDRKLYTVEQVGIFVKAEWITPEQFKEITGFDYKPQAI